MPTLEAMHIPHDHTEQQKVACGCGADLLIRVRAAFGRLVWAEVIAQCNGWSKPRRMIHDAHNIAGECPGCGAPLAFAYTAGEAPPPPIFCPECQHEHKASEEQRFVAMEGETGEGAMLDVLRCQGGCGAVRIDRKWFMPREEG